ncbi:KPN_02809 family neutral zinc metallopeptidase [Compostibacter hankyongensis]|uniref:Neutral zinc metallopeptidase n=1 Tax=Compostibacter hankyongensis TaxID=1007089 RepID=A0ABP8FCL2_9BACT
MRWKGRRQSDNVEDRRGIGGRGLAAGGGIGMVVLIVIALLMGKNPLQLLQQMDAGTAQPAATTRPAGEDEAAAFVRVVLADTEDVWDSLFRQMHRTYTDPVLVMFTGYTESGCGNANAATGPFYCPQDQKVYIDLSFYQELKERFRVQGDFAMAYVIAHEVGHHVQRLLGIEQQMRQQQEGADERTVNALSVKLELQADFLAGVWAHYDQKMKDVVEEGDIEEALDAANAIGDDKLQMQSQGYVVPDAFTHGTSAQRMYWFKKGFETGDIRQGNTFAETGM